MEKLNIYSKSDDWRARRLSNFSIDPFVIDGETMMSVEGFLQGIKFPEGDERRLMAFMSPMGSVAKQLGGEAKGQFVYWKGRLIPYGSIEHAALLERGIRCKFEQSAEAREALRQTAGMELTHVLKEPENPKTCLPAKAFTGLLMKIRTEIDNSMNR